MTRAPAWTAPSAAPMPAGPPPTTSTSASPASSAWRRGSSMHAASSGRLNVGMLLLAGEKRERQPVRLARALLQRGEFLRDMGAHRAAAVPALVEIRDYAPGVDQVERRRRQVERFQKAAHLARVRQRDERRPRDRGQGEEVQPHAEREIE